MTTTDQSSSYHAFSVVCDDARVDVHLSPTGPEPIHVEFVLPDFTHLPDVFLSRAAARQLRDELTRVLLEDAYVEIVTLAAVTS
jgi:hypothetical protein